AAPAEAPAAPTEPQAAVSFPAECEGYLTQINECVEKLGDNTAAADALKQQMERTRASWARLANPDALGAICKKASDDFVQRTKEMGC
ncbi:MAG: glutaconyl-CoA decarboxylase subunit gamma, partial [Burkholderiales bacterium]|nr:glutaconyl-CoA decarboxylase subunit gamma [Burkholderiales bacterium]